MNCHSFLLLLLPFATSARQDLKTVNALRVSGNEYVNKGKADSAVFCFNKVIQDTVYADATDYLILSSSYLMLRDTAAFENNLAYSIQYGGADTNMIFSYFRQNNSEDKSLLRKHLSTSYAGKRQTFLSTIDTNVLREMEDISYLDQLVHQPGTSKGNLPYMVRVGAIIDSINYERVTKLIRENKYPGFHNFGIGSAKYDNILMHISDHNEEQWQFIFDFVKKQALAGNITSKQVVAIATRHYTNNEKCTYYGSMRRGEYPLCDCKKVDEYRAGIGLDDLAAEFKRLNLQLPECYGK